MPDRSLASIPADLPPQCPHGHLWPEDWRPRRNGRHWHCNGCTRDRNARKPAAKQAEILAQARERARKWRAENPEAEKARRERADRRKAAAREVIRALVRDREWMTRAACTAADADLFHAPDGEHEAERRDREAAARAVCSGCPVRAECLAAAVAAGDRHGFAGGMSAEERLRSRRAAA